VSYQIHVPVRFNHTVNLADFVISLKSIAPAQSILTEQEELKPYESDGLAALETLAVVFVLNEFNRKNGEKSAFPQ